MNTQNPATNLTNIRSMCELYKDQISQYTDAGEIDTAQALITRFHSLNLDPSITAVDLTNKWMELRSQQLFQAQVNALSVRHLDDEVIYNTLH